MNLKKAGFTLAEILITLSIIGVIASMTIPSLVQDVQDAQLKTAWKKTYSDLDQATRRVMLENGGNLKTFLANNYTLYLPYKKYLNYTRTDQIGGCPTSYNTNSSTWAYGTKKLDGSLEYYCKFDDGGFVLSNGTLLAIDNCVTCNTPTIIWADINGFKGPNTIGKDIFGARVYPYGIKPLGSQGDSFESTCSKTSSGWGCAAKYLNE